VLKFKYYETLNELSQLSVIKIIIQVRCTTCGKVLGHLYADYKKRIDSGENPGKVLDELGLKRYCCRQTVMGHVDLLKEISKFKP